MDWIKRNLYFVIGSAVAVLLMGAAGYFLYSKNEANNQIIEKLNADYEELKRLNTQSPHPGSGQTDNIKLAREQQAEVRAFVQKTRDYFQRIAPIPEVAKITDRDLSAALSRTISQLQKDAASANVTLPPNFNFSFEAEKQKVSFAPTSLAPLSVQLGEVKTFCEVLFRAKINALDSIRRERVSVEDAAGSPADYLMEQSVTNDLAVLTPYEVVFRSFSSELATVLSGFATLPYPILVKSINVEPAAAAGAPMPGVEGGMMPTPQPAYVPPPAGAMRGLEDEMGAAAARARMMMYPGYAQPTVAAAAPGAKGGMPTVLDEKPLKITMRLVVVKLLPSK